MTLIRALWAKFEQSEVEKDPLKDRYEARRKSTVRMLDERFGDKASKTVRKKLDEMLETATKFAEADNFVDALAGLDDIQRKINKNAVVPSLDSYEERFPDCIDSNIRGLKEAALLALNDFDGKQADTAIAALEQAVKTAIDNQKTLASEFKKLEHRLAAVDAKVASGAFGTPLPKTVEADYDKLLKARRKVEETLANSIKVSEPQFLDCLQVVTPLLKAVEAAAPTGASKKEEFEARKAPLLDGVCKGLDLRVAGEFKDTENDGLAQAVKAYTKASADVLEAESGAVKSGDYDGAVKALDSLELAVHGLLKAAPGYKPPVDSEEQANRQIREYDKRYEALGAEELAGMIKGGVFGDTPPKEVDTAIKEFEKSNTAYNSRRNRGNWDGVGKALEALEPAVQYLRKQADDASDILVGKVIDRNPSKAVRTEIHDDLVKNPVFRRKLAESDKGKKLLDGLVADLGDKVGNKTDKEFLGAALKARYGLNVLSGGDNEKGLSSKALPRLYRVMGIVPDSHTTDNKKLLEVVRNKGNEEEKKGVSVYEAGKGRIAICVGRTTGSRAKKGNEGEAKKVYKNVGEKTAELINLFDGHTLHEIGHSVDDLHNFMNKKQAGGAYGGWRPSSPAEALGIMGEQLGFYAKFKGKLPDDALKAVLEGVLKGRDPGTVVQGFVAANTTNPDTVKADPGVTAAATYKVTTTGGDAGPELLSKVKEFTKKVKLKDKALKELAVEAITQALDKSVKDNDRRKKADEVVDNFFLNHKATNFTPADAKEIAEHPAVEWGRAVIEKGTYGGLYWGGDAAAQKYSVGGRIYQESYPDKWWSYSLAARGTAVSEYQFRAPGEWFAEAYSAFYEERLPTSHPLHGWLQAQGPPRKT